MNDIERTIKELEVAATSAKNIQEKIESLNKLAWELRNTDLMRGLHLAEEAGRLARDIHFADGIAHSLKYLAYYNFRQSNLQGALALSNQALEQFELARNLRGEATIYSLIGQLHERAAKYPEAIASHQRSMEKARQANDKQQQANALNNTALIYGKLSDFPRCLNLLRQCLALREETKDQFGEGAALNNIGIVYKMLGDYKSALSQYESSLKIYEALGDPLQQGAALNNIGNIYLELGDNPRALTFYQRSLKIDETHRNDNARAISQSGIGRVYFQMHDFPQALLWQQQCLQGFRNVSDRNSEASTLIAIARIYFAMNELNTSIENLDQSVTISEEIRSKASLIEAFQLLSEVYEMKGETKLALDYHKKYYAIGKEVFNEESVRKTKNLLISYQVEQTQKEAEFHKLKSSELKEANRALRNALREAEEQRLITDAQKLIAQEANAFKTELLGIAAHDLKNPLQSIMGFSELIKESTSLDTAKNMSEHIASSSKRMLKLISDLLGKAEQESGKLELKKQKTNLTSLAAECVEQMQSLASVKSQKIITEFVSNCEAEVDSERIREALENLISNAIKYSPNGKPIFVSLKKVKDEKDKASEVIRFSVKDEGAGLTSADKKKLFGKFQRLSAKPTNGESSNGLGLSIVKHLIELHDGKVWAESKGLGKGSTFFISIPI